VGGSPAPPKSPAPAPEEAKTEQPASKPEQPKQKLIAGIDELTRSINIPQYMSRQVIEGFTDEFSKLSSVAVTTERMQRRDAIERAKKETATYVVLLQLETEYLSSSGGIGQVSPDEVLVTYTIFTPGTGKVKSNGRIYARSSRGGILGGRFPTGGISDSQLYQTGREAADRVMSALGMGAIMR
jgi:hypothetical protein